MSNQQETTAGGHFDADRPIERREQDRLGRRSFAEAIARQVRAVPAEHGFTVAVEGEWGSGKTSVLNMVAETLEADDDVALLHFNPWLFSSADDLVTRFFSELSAQLDQDRFEGLKDVATALVGMGQVLAPLFPVPGATGMMNVAADQITSLMKPPSLHEKRDRLRRALEQADSRIVVVVDDIDRLEPGEIREVMRLVRLTSDLPNVVFLMAFDSGHVARGLRENEGEGRRYLEKIVQVSHDLPTVREAILPDMFLRWLDELIRGRDLTELDRDVWGRVFYDVIRPLLGNLRDVKRYIYSLPVTLDTIGQEVALADLLGLEALRVLRPPLFNELRTHVNCLVHSESVPESWLIEEVRNREIEKILSVMLDRAEDNRAILNAVFEILFPATQTFLGRMGHGPEWDAVWRKQRRVACEEVLRIYLQAGLDEGTIPSREIQDLVGALTDDTKLVSLLDALDEQRLEAALERLEDYEHDFPMEAAPVAVPVLLNRIWRLSPHSAGALGLAPRSSVTRVVLRLLSRFENAEELATRLSTILEGIDTLSGLLAIVEMVGYRQLSGRKLVGEEQARKLEEQLVDRLKSATAEDLRGEWNLFALSLRPLNWVEGEEKSRLTSRLREHLVDDGFVLTLLRTSVDYAYLNGRPQKRLFWDLLVEIFGDGLLVAVNRLGHSQLYHDLSQEDQDTINLAEKYATGWQPRGLHNR